MANLDLKPRYRSQRRLSRYSFTSGGGTHRPFLMLLLLLLLLSVVEPFPAFSPAIRTRARSSRPRQASVPIHKWHGHVTTTSTMRRRPLATSSSPSEDDDASDDIINVVVESKEEDSNIRHNKDPHSSDTQKEKQKKLDLKRRKRVLLQDFERDVTHVLKELRASDTDPTLPAPFHRNTQRPSFTKTWSLRDWDRHTSRLRYWHYLRFLPASRLLKRILPHLVLLTSWSVFVVGAFALPAGASLLDKISSSNIMTPLSLVSTIVFALESLRSNQGLSRLNEGRKA